MVILWHESFYFEDIVILGILRLRTFYNLFQVCVHMPRLKDLDDEQDFCKPSVLRASSLIFEI